MSGLKCPVCRTPLSQDEYDKALGLWKDKQTHIKHLEEERKRLQEQERLYKQQAKAQTRQFKQQQRELLSAHRQQVAELAKAADKRLQAERKTFKAQLQTEVKKGVERGVRKQQVELRKSQNKMAQLENSLKLSADRYAKASEEIHRLKKQIEQGITPQIEGLLEEHNLLAKLKELYPQDRFDHTGKGGDILQTVVDHGKEVGLILYECKKVKGFSAAHVEQTKRARSQRHADFAVLVTNAFPKKKQHYFVEKDVFVISPVSVEPISYTLRESLVRMAMLKLTHQAKQDAVQRVYDYLSSADYNTKMKDVAAALMELGSDLKTEIEVHGRIWKKRYAAYRGLFLDIGGIDHRLRTLAHGLEDGKSPKLLVTTPAEYPTIKELEK